MLNQKAKIVFFCLLLIATTLLSASCAGKRPNVPLYVYSYEDNHYSLKYDDAFYQYDYTLARFRPIDIDFEKDWSFAGRAGLGDPDFWRPSMFLSDLDIFVSNDRSYIYYPFDHRLFVRKDADQYHILIKSFDGNCFGKKILQINSMYDLLLQFSSEEDIKLEDLVEPTPIAWNKTEHYVYLSIQYEEFPLLKMYGVNLDLDDEQPYLIIEQKTPTSPDPIEYTAYKVRDEYRVSFMKAIAAHREDYQFPAFPD